MGRAFFKEACKNLQSTEVLFVKENELILAVVLSEDYARLSIAKLF